MSLFFQLFFYFYQINCDFGDIIIFFVGFVIFSHVSISYNRIRTGDRYFLPLFSYCSFMQ